MASLSETELKSLTRAIALALFIENLDISILANALAEISASLGISPKQTRLAMLAYLFSLGAFIIMAVKPCRSRAGI